MKHGVHWPLLIYGISASVLLALGLIPPYFELAKRKGRVIGINPIFLGTDLCGAIFSLASLAVDTSNFDIMGCVIYCICASMEIGIFASHFVWFCRFRLLGPKTSSERNVQIDPEDELNIQQESIKENKVDAEKKLHV